MGTGKTRALEEMARRELCYVSSLNVATEKAFTFPKRSLIADDMDKIKSRDVVTTYFECYIASTLEQVMLCRQVPGRLSEGFLGDSSPREVRKSAVKHRPSHLEAL